MIKRLSRVLLLIIGLIYFTGCVSPQGMTSATTPIQGRKYEIIGPTDGRSNLSWAILGLWTVNRADIERAIKEAVKKKKGDALINVRWYEKTYYCILFSLHRIYVTGDAIRFTDIERKEVVEEELKKDVPIQEDKKDKKKKKKKKRKSRRSKKKEDESLDSKEVKVEKTEVKDAESIEEK